MNQRNARDQPGPPDGEEQPDPGLLVTTGATAFSSPSVLNLQRQTIAEPGGPSGRGTDTLTLTTAIGTPSTVAVTYEVESPPAPTCRPRTQRGQGSMSPFVNEAANRAPSAGAVSYEILPPAATTTAASAAWSQCWPNCTAASNEPSATMIGG